MQTGTLYIVATPIGNLGDITIRALDVLKSVDLIASEDTRQVRKLLSHFDIHARVVSYHDHSSEGKLEGLISELKAGKTLALVSDSGTPVVSDPGFPFVRRALEEGIKVEPIPGPTAFVAALVASGLTADSFTFLGFLSPKSGKRKKSFESVKEEPRTLIFYESPHRIVKFLTDAKEVLGERKVVIAREITKKFEEFMRGTPSELIEEIGKRKVLGELVVLIEGIDKRQKTED